MCCYAGDLVLERDDHKNSAPNTPIKVVMSCLNGSSIISLQAFTLKNDTSLRIPLIDVFGSDNSVESSVVSLLFGSRKQST